MKIASKFPSYNLLPKAGSFELGFPAAGIQFSGSELEKALFSPKTNNSGVFGVYIIKIHQEVGFRPYVLWP